MIHMIGLPHTQFNDRNFSFCAFTAKAVRLARMLRATGREVTVYWGGDEGDVSLMSRARQDAYFGEYTGDKLPTIGWDSRSNYWVEFNLAAIKEIRARIQPGDIVATIGGPISQVVIDEFRPDYTCVEPGVGYEGLTNGAFACFESYAWMHNRYGAYYIGDGRPFDAVIPNAVVPEEWSVGESKGYALFVGRLIQRKGAHVAEQIARAAGLPLLMAGGGVAEKSKGRVVATDGTLIEGDVEHVGSLVGEERRELFANAEVLICPTLYIGPWEGVHAEAMMSGVPVVAPDYGVFTETLPPMFRYRTLPQAVAAIHAAKMTRGQQWRDHAIESFGIDVCTRMYDAWFDRLESLRDGRNGWYG